MAMESNQERKQSEEQPTNARLQHLQVKWQRTSAVVHIISLVAVTASLAFVAYGWERDAQKRRTDRTLDYINKVADRDFVNSLWDLQEFTVCFERHKKDHISYQRYA